MGVIHLVAPIKSRRIKQNSQEWFDGEIAEKNKCRDELFKKFKKSRLHIEFYIKIFFLRIDSMILLVNLKSFERL